MRFGGLPEESNALLQKLLGYQVGPWKAPQDCEGDACTFVGAIKLSTPRRLDREDCRFLIDVTEELRHAGSVRTQMRTYCTENGFNRKVDHAGPVT